MGLRAEGDGGIKTIEIAEEVEGDRQDSDDYFFDKIGKPIPIVKDSADSPIFDLQSPPSRPLAVSEFHHLIFLAHSSGFYVARTKDVMDAAEDMKANGTASSIQELSIVDVSVGKVHILSLSSDSSTLAVSVAADVHFFAVDSLLHKELKPSSSCSLSDSSAAVKDMQWRRGSEASYVVLSNRGKLCHGALGGPLKDVMDDVDAVEWSFKGKHIAVARENIFHILSSKFKERLQISLPIKSWIGDSDDNCRIKVDSIRWVRLDSIVVGCFQQTADGEENYLIQVIRSKGGKITDASSKPSVLSFYDIFSGLIDDIMPHGNGPYLLLSYLQQCGLAITANRKNTDQHILLLYWSEADDMSETAVIDIDRDTWIPRIELQANGDDNLILGLCVDTVSLYGKVKVEVGLEQKELSPYCALFCVTLEGKLVMYYFASATRPTADPILNDEEDDSLSDATAGHDQSISLVGGQEFEQVGLGLQPKDVSQREPNVSEGTEILTKGGIIPSGNSENSMAVLVREQICHKDVINKEQEVESPINIKPSITDAPDKFLVSKLYKGVDGQQVDAFGQQGARLEQSSLKNSLLHEPSHFVNPHGKAETEKIAEFKSTPVSFAEKAPTFPSKSSGKDLQKCVNLPKASPVAITSTNLQGSPSQSQSSGKLIFSGGSESRPFPSSTSFQGLRSDNTGNSSDAGYIPAPHVGKPFHPKDTIAESPSTNYSVRSAPIVGPKASTRTGKINSFPSNRSSQLPSQETFTLGRSPNHRPHSSNEAHRAPSASISEPYFSRQFGNIQDMTKELDILLECIEKPGGFRDACTVSQRSLVEAFEERMQILFEKCRMWKSLMDDQLGEIQHLLDKTVQVLARKLYMDGIVKQASDSKYWELWNCQKLSSELELKRRHISKLNQVLTNQLIELERHFNTLELHKFSENGGVHTGRRTLQSRYGPSRQVQSLHSLHNTTNSQLAAAEQLSECLAKQMEVLSIESPVKQKNIKKELFESIGIPYDSTFSSPDAAKVGDTSPLNKLLLSDSAVNKSQSTRRQSSAMKNSDSETARRRRDSLDQSWASFEPTKTTIKRVLLQESQKTSVSKSSLMDGHQLDPSVVDRYAFSRLRDLTSSSTFMYQSGNKGIQYMPPELAFGMKSTPSKWGNDSPSPCQPTDHASGFESLVLPSSNAVLPSVSASQALHLTAQTIAAETGNVTADKLSDRVSSVEKSNYVLINETKSIQQSETTSCKNSSFSIELPTQTTLMKLSEMVNSNARGTVLSNVMSDTRNHGSSAKGSFSFQTAAAPLVHSHVGEVPQFNVPASKSQPSGKASFSPAFSMSLSVSSSPLMNASSDAASSAFNPSSITPSSSAAMLFGMPLDSYKANTGSGQTVALTISSSVSSPAFPSSSFSLQAPKSFSPTHAAPAVSESDKTELQSGSVKMPPPLDPSRSSSMSESLKTEVQLPSATASLSISSTPPSSPDSSKPGCQPFPVKISPTSDSTSTLASEPVKTQLQHFTDKVSSRTDVDTVTTALQAQPGPPASSFKIEPPVSSVPTTEISTDLGSGNQPSLNSMTSLAAGAIMQPKQPPDVHVLFRAPQASGSPADGRNANLEVAVTEEDEMEEEAPETNRTNETSLGSLGSFGLGSTPSSDAPKANPFGGSFGNIGTNQAGSPFTMTVRSGELFRPASFNFQSPLSNQPSQPANLGAFCGGFGAAAGQAPAPSAFGQPAQIGAAVGQPPAPSAFGQAAQIGAGQQALGSVLGSFGQSRQFGTGLPGGFAGTSSTGGFSGATNGGFATVGGGFAGLASGGAFGGISSAGGGFGAVTASGGGFASAGGGFGAFSSQQGFSAFGGNTGGNQQSGGLSSFGGKPAELFTQMRK